MHSSAKQRFGKPPLGRGAGALPVLLSAALLLVVGGCSRIGDIPFLYKVDIQQGNVIDNEMLSLLEPGMEKRRVLFVLGTPLLADTFHEDRWDYFYSYAPRGEDREQRQITLLFENDRLDRVEGDIEPRLGPALPPARKEVLVEVPPIDRREGLLAALTPNFMKDDKPIRIAEQPDVDPDALAQVPSDGVPRPTVVGDSGTVDEPTAGPAVALALPDVRTEQAFLTDLFQGYGRYPQTAAPRTGSSVSSTARTPAGAAGSQSGAPGQSDPDVNPEDAGFFRDLANRYDRWQDEASSSSQQGLKADDLESQGQN